MWVLVLVSLPLIVVTFFSRKLLPIITWVVFLAVVLFCNPSHQDFRFDMTIKRISRHRNWPSTFDMPEGHYHEPLSETELVDFLKHNARSLRVMGGMESYSPLIHSATVLNIKHLNRVKHYNGSHIRCEAGMTIKEVQDYLANYRQTLRGIGTYLDTTLGGAFSTSFSGRFQTSFSDHVTWARTLNAVGTSIEWIDDLFYLRDSMGMLGIVVEMELQVFPNRDYEIFYKQRDIGWTEPADGFQMNTHLYASQGEAATYRLLPGPPEFVNRQGSYWVMSEIYDFIYTPISYFIPIHWIGQPDARQTIRQLSTNDVPYFGLTYLNYRIPVEFCKAFLNEMEDQDGLVRVKYLPPKQACLAHHQSVCEVEIHIPNHKYIIQYESLVRKYGGYSHWGGYYEGNITKQIESFDCYVEFEKLRKKHDPTGRFLNNYLKGVPGAQYYWRSAGRVYVYCIVLALFVIVTIFSYWKQHITVCGRGRTLRKFKT
jgi:hypothetical protein